MSKINQMQSQRTTVYILVVLAIASMALTTAAQAGDDTARFNGSWKADFIYNGQTLTMVSIHDGKGYKNYVLIPPNSAFVGDGTFSAADGKWRTSADKPNDTGTYHFVDNNAVLCTNAIGQSLLWQRYNAPLPPIIGGAANSPAGANQLPAGTNLAQVKTTQAIQIARKVALAWQPDAILVTVRVFGSNNDGTINMLANPSAFTMIFYSPSAKSGLTVVSAAPFGTFYPQPMAGAPPNAMLLSIPPQAVDLAVAFSNVRLFGFNGPMSQADLIFANEAGKPIRLVWEIQSGEAYPRVVSGATGAILSPFTVLDDKVADYNKLAADTAAAVARMQAAQHRRPGMQNHGGEWVASGLHYWEGSSAENGSHDSTNDSSPTEQDTWDNDVGAQNAWEDGNYEAEANFDAGEATPVEQAAYGNGGE